MPEKYIYNGKIVQRADVEEAAKRSSLDLDAYLQKSGISVVNDNYNFNGKTISAEEILNAANQSKLGFDDYIQKAAITAIPDVKKKEASDEELPTGSATPINGAETIAPLPLESDSESNGAFVSGVISAGAGLSSKKPAKSDIKNFLNGDNKFTQPIPPATGDLASYFPTLEHVDGFSVLGQQKAAKGIEESLKSPTVSGIKNLAETGLKQKVSDIYAGLYFKNQERKEQGKKELSIDLSAVKKELTDQFNKRFLAGELTDEDIEMLKIGNPLVRKGDSGIDNSKIAAQINQKSKNLKDFARAKDVDGNSYYFTNKGIQQRLDFLTASINNAEAGNDSDDIDVDGNLMPRGDYLKKLRQEKQDLVDQQWFLKNDFKNNRFDPVAKKYVSQLISDISKSGEIDMAGIGGTGISQDEDLYIKKYVDSYLKKQNNPVINAEAGNTEAPLQGREYNTVYNEVRDYFHNIVPVKNWVDNSMKAFMQPEKNKQFAPIIDNYKKINEYFSTDETQKFESILNATTDANQSVIFDKYNKILSANPKFVDLLNKYKSEVENNLITKEESLIALEKELRSIPELQPILKQQDKEIQGTIIAATKEREKRLINGLSDLPKNIIMYDDGTIGVNGKTKEETKKFVDDYIKTTEDATKRAVENVANDRKVNADELMTGAAKYTTGIAQGYGSMMESATRWLSNSFGVGSSMRDYYSTGNKVIGEVVENSEWAKNHFKFNGIRSLLDPAYYAYNVGQSAPYMIPGALATIATGGGAGGAIIGGTISSAIETAQNKLQIYNDLLTTGKDEHGLAITPYGASKAMADDNEFLPNLLLASLEFGTLFRAAKTVKPSINIAGGIADLGKTGVAESSQESIQGWYQYNAQQKALGKPELDVWDYMQTDDFRQNFYAGGAGGTGFGVGAKSAQMITHSRNVSDWKKMVESGNDELARGSLYSYIQQKEKNNQGSLFRDGLKLRLQNEQYKDESERKGLLQFLDYSVKLADAVKQLNVSPDNITGMAAAHNIALSELNSDLANDNEGKAIQKVYNNKSKEYLDRAEQLINGNTEDLYYVNSVTGNPVFISKQTANTLQQEGVLDKLVKDGKITGASDNIKLQPIPEKSAPAPVEDKNERFKPKPVQTPEEIAAPIVEKKISPQENIPDALKDVESTEKALEDLDEKTYYELVDLQTDTIERDKEVEALDKLNLSAKEHNKRVDKINKKYEKELSVSLAQAYHNAKADGSNPELVKAVEDTLAPNDRLKPQPVQTPEGIATLVGNNDIVKRVEETLNIPNEEAEVLSMLHSSNILTPVEKRTLYRQYKSGVMSATEVNKYTGVDVADIQSGNLDKWANVVLSKMKGKKIEAEDISFEEVEPVSKPIATPVEDKNADISSEQDVIDYFNKKYKGLNARNIDEVTLIAESSANKDSKADMEVLDNFRNRNEAQSKPQTEQTVTTETQKAADEKIIQLTEERDSKLKDAFKPEIDLEDLGENDLNPDKHSSKLMATQSAKRTAVVKRFENLKKLIECVWT